ncbi:hypothetical protein M513_07526 [Trichuris suis]|uniref:Uncharacterized protein n=1 Tax=Trichuris suis TaxID=68888 RepID=A0A085M351_9BILA|nr:hypothetical protein M513_07526 [Trichuris suis]
MIYCLQSEWGRRWINGHLSDQRGAWLLLDGDNKCVLSVYARLSFTVMTSKLLLRLGGRLGDGECRKKT